MAFQFEQTGQEIQDILNQVGDNTSDISALDTRLTTAEEDIDAAQEDISALNLSLAHTTDNGWSVIKYPDGIFEAACSYQSLSYGTGSAFGNALYFHLSSVIPMPSCAVTITSLVATPSAAQLNMVCGTNGLSLTNTCLYLANATSANGNCPVFLRITGTWQ